MTLPGNRVFVDVIIKMISYWIRVHPKSGDCDPSKKRGGHTEIHSEGEGHVRMKAETGRM